MRIFDTDFIDYYDKVKRIIPLLPEGTRGAHYSRMKTTIIAIKNKAEWTKLSPTVTHLSHFELPKAYRIGNATPEYETCEVCQIRVLFCGTTYNGYGVRRIPKSF